MSKLNRIALFRYHNNFAICSKRLAFIRKLNPDLSIYGLFGGKEEEFETASDVLGHYFAHNYCIREKTDFWKWINSDLVYRLWYKDYGYQLDFTSLVVLEWDLLLFGSLDQVYHHIPEGAVGLSGLIPLRKIEKKWFWAYDPVQGQNWRNLLSFVRTNYGYKGHPFACVGPGVCLPKKFLEQYAAIEIPEPCNDELRLPLMGEALGFPLADTGFFRRWFSKREFRYFNCNNFEVSEKAIRRQLRKRNGRRVFHPCREDLNLDELQAELQKPRRLFAF